MRNPPTKFQEDFVLSRYDFWPVFRQADDLFFSLMFCGILGSIDYTLKTLSLYCFSSWWDLLCVCDSTGIIIVWTSSHTMTWCLPMALKWQKDTKPASAWRTQIVTRVNHTHPNFTHIYSQLCLVRHIFTCVNICVYARCFQEIWVCELWWAGHHSGMLGFVSPWHWLPVDRYYWCQTRKLYPSGQKMGADHCPQSPKTCILLI